MSLEYNKKLIPRAKKLRKNMTRHEKHLWYDFLSKYAQKFQRRKTIGSYIVDFYCHSAKIIIEVDGNQHYTDEAIKYDIERTNFLNACELKVIRFSNYDIDKNFPSVCQLIDKIVKDKINVSTNFCGN